VAKKPGQIVGLLSWESGAGASHDHEGQLILTSHEMQTRLGQKFCTDTELLPLMFAHGLVRRARNIRTAVIPLDGDSIFKVVQDSSNPIVGAAKLAIFRMRGALEDFSMLLENPEAQPIGKVHDCEFGVLFDENEQGRGMNNQITAMNHGGSAGSQPPARPYNLDNMKILYQVVYVRIH
jgi:hypothetical protein